MTTLAHSARWSTGPRTMPPRLVVIHDSEGSEGPNSAEQLVSFIAAPPQLRPDGTYNRASYHFVIDTDRRIQTVDDHLVAFSAPGANTDGLHACIPGKASQTREQWLDETSSAAIGQLARLIVDKSAQYGRDYSRRLTVAEVVAGQVGYCAHIDITNAYHRTDHWDPGPGFPYDVLDAYVSALRPDTEEDSMKPSIWRATGDFADWLVYGSTRSWIPTIDDRTAAVFLGAGTQPDGSSFAIDRKQLGALGGVVGPMPPGNRDGAGRLL